MHGNQFAANQLAFVPAATFPIRAEARIGSLVLKTEVCPIKCFLFRLHVNFCAYCEELLLILDSYFAIIEEKRPNIYASIALNIPWQLALTP